MVKQNDAYVVKWHFFDLAPKAAIGTELDIWNFAQMAALSAELPICLPKVNARFGSCADLQRPKKYRRLSSRMPTFNPKSRINRSRMCLDAEILKVLGLEKCNGD